MDKIIAIAIDEYSNSPERNLKNCLNDINIIVNILSTDYEYDFEYSGITLYTRPEQTTLSYLYKSLNEEFINALESDSILLIFAGHGEYNHYLNTGYWLCSDSKFDDPTTWFDINILISFLTYSKAKHIAVISDSCFSGSIFNRTRGGGLGALVDKKSRQALTSGGLEVVSDGIENDNSPFNKAIQLTLKENDSDTLSFNSFCETTIKNFPISKKQTPEFGSLNIVGDAGGTYIFKKKIKDSYNGISYINMILPLKIDRRINIDSKINIPIFSGKTNIDLNIINIFVQRLGYEIINDIRAYASMEIDHLIERSSQYPFQVESYYTIHRFDQEYLSIELSHSDDFANIHPNYYTYSINFKFNPTRQVSIYDVFEINGIDELSDLINQFSEVECKSILLNALNEINIYKLDFAFNERTLFLYFTNHLPHAFKACGTVEVPLENVSFRS
ncbi:caspase family protein [Acinetobacter pittii]|uniref:caspase family protein n=1 Tax=Acinetobacter pittii TaxID=48296 RepID=UPI000C1549AF|nr:caspase family protein [Acinetobacter pittii]